MSAQIISQRIFQRALSWWKKLLETEKTQKQLSLKKWLFKTKLKKEKRSQSN
jgi:hypothetical protein